MRHSKQYSIIDHELLHRGYFHKLSHEALVLYFFLITVGDKDGKSYYSTNKIIQILRLNSYKTAVFELSNSELIIYRQPYFWVRNFEPSPSLGTLFSSSIEDTTRTMTYARKGDLNSTRQIIKKLFLNEK